MTVGEKIQFYRKRAGLSQEELGQQLLVSRQTVSLWETGQTLPTLDNLSRLRTIFGISIDEILCEECSDTEEMPKEQDAAASYPYHEQEDRIGTQRAFYAHVVLTALSLFVLAFGVVSLFFAPVWPLICVAVGAAACFFCQTGLLLKSTNRICATRTALVQNEVLSQEKGERKGKKKRLAAKELVGVGAGAFAALLTALVLAAYGTPWGSNVAALTLLAAALPALVCVAIYILRRRTQRGWQKKAVIAGLLAALLITGCVGTVASCLPRPARDTQRALRMTIPACENIVITQGGYASDELFVYYRADFYLGEDEALAWEAELTQPQNPFVTPAASAASYFPSSDFGRGATSFLLFDTQAKQSVTVLEGKGYHEYLLFAYFPMENLLSVAKCNLYIAE